MEQQEKFAKLFPDEPWSYFFKAAEFFWAAHYLDQTVKQGEKTWDQEMKKVLKDVPPGVVVEYSPSEEEIIANTMRFCERPVIYYYAHTLELLLKGLAFHKLGGFEKDHKLSDLFKNLEEFIGTTSFKKEELNIFLLKLDEVLIWAGRYPSPKKKHSQKAISTIALVKVGEFYSQTSNIAASVDVNLLKKLIHQIIALPEVRKICPILPIPLHN